MDYTHHYVSPLGGITLASDGEYLTGLWFDGQKYFADTLSVQHDEKDLDVFRRTDNWLDIYFSGKEPNFTPPLRMKGTEFRQEVWQILLTIPFGKTMTYGDSSYHPVRKNYDLRCNREDSCRPVRSQCNVGSGRRRRCRPQPNLAHHPLPSSGRNKRSPHRLCGRARKKGLAS